MRARDSLDQLSSHGSLEALDVGVIVLLVARPERESFLVRFSRGEGRTPRPRFSLVRVIARSVLDESRPCVPSLKESKKRASEVAAATTALGPSLN